MTILQAAAVHGPDERTRGVIFIPVSTGIAHASDPGFIELRQLVAFGLGIEGQPVHCLQHVTQNMAGAEFVAQFREHLTDLVFDDLRSGRGLPDRCEVGEQLLIDELDQVVADAVGVVVELTVFPGRGTTVPEEIPGYD